MDLRRISEGTSVVTRVGVTGTFDVENYGDLLLAKILAKRLEEGGMAVDFYSPVGGPAVWSDTPSTAATAQLVQESRHPGALIVGGGNIIHAARTRLSEYTRSASAAIASYADLWLLPARHAAETGARLAWNAPGVPRSFAPESANVLRWAVERADYVAVRDRRSRENLRTSGIRAPIAVVPDTGLGIVDLWSEAKLDEVAYASLDRAGLPPDEPFIAAHVNSRYIVSADAAAARLDALCRITGARAIALVATGPCHGDDELASAVAEHLVADHLLLNRPRSVREVAAVVRAAQMFVGSSLHGLVTSLAFGRPTVLVAGDGTTGANKGDGFLEQFGLLRFRAATWDGVHHVAKLALDTEDEVWKSVSQRAKPLLDEHWARVVAAVSDARRATDAIPPYEQHAFPIILEVAQQLFDEEREVSRKRRDADALVACHREELDNVSGALDRLDALFPSGRHDSAQTNHGAEPLPESKRIDEFRTRVLDLKQDLALCYSVNADITERNRHLELRLSELEEERNRLEDQCNRLVEERNRLSGSMRRVSKIASHLEDVAADVSTAAEYARALAGTRTWRTGRAIARVASALRGSRAAWDSAERLATRLDDLAVRAARIAEVDSRPGDATAGVGGASEAWQHDADEDDATQVELRVAREVAAVAPSSLSAREPATCSVLFPASRHVAGDEPRVLDVVVCVHNALLHVKRCLGAVVERTQVDFHLVIVDDGSDSPTAEFLARFAALYSATLVRRDDEPHGYTIAANAGLRQTTAEHVILLNSDTTVTTGWDTALIAAANASSASLVGPLSNAATYQSVPLVSDGGGWATNELPDWVTPETMSALVQSLSRRTVPDVKFLNGFCLLIAREAMDSIGGFDEANFGPGYCEETDYAIRVRETGRRLVVADDAYVHHAKTRSYGSAHRRKELNGLHRERLFAKYGRDRIEQDSAEMLELTRDLDPLRAELKVALSSPTATADALRSAHRRPKTVSFLLGSLSAGGAGGAHSIWQEVGGLRELGVEARIVLPSKNRDRVIEQYGALERFLLVGSPDEAVEVCAASDVAVATHFTTVEEVAVAARHGRCMAAYYVQDYEPLFTTDPDVKRAAAATYTALPDLLLFAKTEWLRRIVMSRHDVTVHKVEPSLDHDVYRPGVQSAQSPLEIAAMVRPRTPRRQPARTLQLAEALAGAVPDCKVTVFGATDAELDRISVNWRGRVENAGRLHRSEVAAVLANAHLFLDLSVYQAFGRTAMEAMACGCVPVVPHIGGALEFVEDRQNGIVIDTSAPNEKILAVVRAVASDRPQLAQLRETGLSDARRYSILRAAASEQRLFATEFARRS